MTVAKFGDHRSRSQDSSDLPNFRTGFQDPASSGWEMKRTPYSGDPEASGCQFRRGAQGGSLVFWDHGSIVTQG